MIMESDFYLSARTPDDVEHLVLQSCFFADLATAMRVCHKDFNLPIVAYNKEGKLVASLGRTEPIEIIYWYCYSSTV